MPQMTFDALDEVPENLRAAAKEVEGKFVLDASGVLNKNRELLEKVSKSKTSLDEFTNLKTKLGELDLDELLDMYRQQQEAAKKTKPKAADGTSEEELERLQEKWRKAKEKELAPLNEKLTALEIENKKLKLDDKVKAGAIAGGINPRFLEDALTVAAKRFALGEGDKILILDTDGDPTDQTLEKFWTETFKEERPIYYPAQNQGGSGAGGTLGNTGKLAALDMKGFSPIERLKAARRAKAA